jgi:hypothetical protein
MIAVVQPVCHEALAARGFFDDIVLLLGIFLGLEPPGDRFEPVRRLTSLQVKPTPFIAFLKSGLKIYRVYRCFYPVSRESLI